MLEKPWKHNYILYIVIVNIQYTPSIILEQSPAASPRNRMPLPAPTSSTWVFRDFFPSLKLLSTAPMRSRQLCLWSSRGSTLDDAWWRNEATCGTKAWPWKWMKTIPKTLTASHQLTFQTFHGEVKTLWHWSMLLCDARPAIGHKVTQGLATWRFSSICQIPALSCRIALQSPRLLYSLSLDNGGLPFPSQVYKRCKKWKKNTHLASSMSIWWYRKAYSQK